MDAAERTRARLVHSAQEKPQTELALHYEESAGEDEEEREEAPAVQAKQAEQAKQAVQDAVQDAEQEEHAEQEEQDVEEELVFPSLEPVDEQLYQFPMWDERVILKKIKDTGSVKKGQEDFAVLILVVLLLSEYGYNESIYLGIESLVIHMLGHIKDWEESSEVVIVSTIPAGELLTLLVAAAVDSVKTNWNNKHMMRGAEEDGDEEEEVVGGGKLCNRVVIKREDAAKTTDVPSMDHPSLQYVGGFVAAIYGA